MAVQESVLAHHRANLETKKGQVASAQAEVQSASDSVKQAQAVLALARENLAVLKDEETMIQGFIDANTPQEEPASE